MVGWPIARVLSVAGLTTLPMLVGCAPSPSCAGGMNPPPVDVSLDARAWVDSHPGVAEVVGCTRSYPCSRMSASSLSGRVQFVGNAPGSVPRGAGVPIRVRAYDGKGRLLLRAAAVGAPKITNHSSPCGDYYSAAATFVMSAKGQLSIEP